MTPHRRAGLGLVALTAALAAGAACRGSSPPGRDAGPAAAAAPRTADAAELGVSRAAETVVLDEVEVRLRGAAEPALDANGLGRTVARCLIDAGRAVALERQVPPGHAPRPARLRIEIAAEPPAKGSRVTVVMDTQLTWLGGDGPAPSAIASGDATPVGGNVDTAIIAVTQQLQDAVCTDLGARLALWSTDDLRPALVATADPGLTLWALHLVAHRGPAPDLLDAVLPSLDRDPPLRDAAIAALVALGDPRAVAPLTATADLNDRPGLIRLIEAARTLGGDDARDFLDVMASHRDPAIAALARGHVPPSQGPVPTE